MQFVCIHLFACCEFSKQFLRDFPAALYTFVFLAEMQASTEYGQMFLIYGLKLVQAQSICK
ncbi:hypothetical protein HK096_003319 [Nowakowskiella sp. JEL0078]|nr:hypothetical protein HK096_003319 [Nowakowskiella sp. JEL0078]